MYRMKPGGKLRYAINWAVSGILAVNLFIACAGCAAGAPPKPDKIEMVYFYDGFCETCNKVREFYDMLDKELADVKDLYPFEVKTYNVFSTDGTKYEKEFFKKMGVGEEALKQMPVPILVVNGKIYHGVDQVRQNLREAYLTAGEALFGPAQANR